MDGVPENKSSSSTFNVFCLRWVACGSPIVYRITKSLFGWKPKANDLLLQFKEELEDAGLRVRFFIGDCPMRHDMLGLVRH